MQGHAIALTHTQHLASIHFVTEDKTVDKVAVHEKLTIWYHSLLYTLLLYRIHLKKKDHVFKDYESYICIKYQEYHHLHFKINNHLKSYLPWQEVLCLSDTFIHIQYQGNDHLHFGTHTTNDINTLLSVRIHGSVFSLSRYVCFNKSLHHSNETLCMIYKHKKHWLVSPQKKKERRFTMQSPPPYTAIFSLSK